MCVGKTSRFAMVIVMLLLLADVAPALAQYAVDEPAQPPRPCVNNQHIQVTVGLPAAYLPGATPVPGPNPGQVCANVIRGSPYALLNWLEHGEVQAALVSQFTVDVMRSDDVDAYDQEYADFPASALESLPHMVRTITLQDGAGGSLPAERLTAFFDSLGKPDSKGTETILLPNHLSTAIPLLITRAAEYVRSRKLSDQARDGFLTALIGSIRFRLYNDPGTNASRHPTALELAESFEPVPQAVSRSCDTGSGLKCLSEDRLVVRRRLLDRLQGPSAQLRELAAAEAKPTAGSAAPLFAGSDEDEKSLGPIVAQFRDANFRRYQVGNLPQRYFRFNLDELWLILAHEGTPPEASRTSEPGKLALVLTGGGVKAAYQTRMIEHLYRDARLVNAADAPTPATQSVGFVIGTSGGALLGVFVSAINDKLLAAFKAQSGQGLTKIIWDTPGKGIDSGDVFPFLDLPRYGTVLAAFVVLMLVAWVARFYRRWRAGRNPAASPVAPNAPPIGPGRLSESILWYALLFLAPFVVITACRFGGIEDVPWITGVVYAGMLVIGLYADVRLKRKARVTIHNIQMSRTTWAAVALAVAGAIAVVLSITQFVGLTRVAGQRDPAAVWAACAGVCALAFALYFFFASQKDLFDREPRWPIARAFLIVAAIVIVSYIVLWLGALARRATMLEVTGIFWVWFLGTAAALSIVIVVLARVGVSVSEQSQGPLHSTFEYLFGEYRSWTTTSTARRYARFVVVGFIGWMWWNLIAAPSLYGNSNAQDYFRAAFGRFAKTAAGVDVAPELNDQTSYPLTVPFVITATSLEKERELYFLFLGDKPGSAHPGDVTDPAENTNIDAQLGDYAWSNIASDSRWFVLRKANGKDLRETAFASGSPFPVFAAHVLTMSALRTPEHLIDGGFAHNRPLEAARVLGASKVLVINSSPLETGAASVRCRLLVRIGDLACNLPKLVPYLWDRSQIEDILSTRNMLVVSIYPTAEAGGWPLLTDFRGEVVERLVSAADADLKGRVGVVESWGRRARGSTSQLIQYDTSVIR